jgi:nucleotide-binding universal stress UspA family protein
MYKKILVPLDGSGRAEKILPHVEALAQCTGASVIFMEVVEPVPVIMDAQQAVITMQMDEMKSREDEAQSYLTGLAGEFKARNVGASMRVMHGPVVEAICTTAVAEDVDLVAMASHGRGGLARMVYGSVAAGVLQRLDRPLLLIRASDSRV